MVVNPHLSYRSSSSRSSLWLVARKVRPVWMGACFENRKTS